MEKTTRPVSNTTHTAALYQKLCALYKLLRRQRDKMSRADRHGIWKDCEACVIATISEMTHAGEAPNERTKLKHLRAMSGANSTLKALAQLAREENIVRPKQYGQIALLLQEVGKMIGGWIKDTAARQATSKSSTAE